jgi:AbrB family looped-hinge helix DNA binding protein
MTREGQRGTIVVPAGIRERLGLHKDVRLLLIEEEDRLILQPGSSLTDALAGATKGCFGESGGEVDAWLDRERTDR